MGMIKFLCADGKKIDLTRVGDNKIDCIDRSDEEGSIKVEHVRCDVSYITNQKNGSEFFITSSSCRKLWKRNRGQRKTVSPCRI